MPLPLILGGAAAIAAVGGIASGVSGGMKMKEANDTLESAKRKHLKNISRFEETNEKTKKAMDLLGVEELEILKSFEEFSCTIEKIQNRPEFKEYKKDGITLPKYDGKQLKDVSIGAGVLIGGLVGATAGTAGGFAAAGATTSAVMALGTASTGTAISTLSGAAATNATLAALGGGAIAAGGGGIALGTTILGASTLGVGLLVGGLIFNATGNKLSDKADEAWDEMKKAEKTIDKACTYLVELEIAATRYLRTLRKVRGIYEDTFSYVSFAVNKLQKTDWYDFSNEEKVTIENTVRLVGLLYKMCKVSLIKKDTNNKDFDTVNYNDMNKSMNEAEVVLNEL